MAHDTGDVGMVRQAGPLLVLAVIFQTASTRIIKICLIGDEGIHFCGGEQGIDDDVAMDGFLVGWMIVYYFTRFYSGIWVGKIVRNHT